MKANINNTDLQMEIWHRSYAIYYKQKDIQEVKSHKKTISIVEVLQRNVEDVHRWTN